MKIIKFIFKAFLGFIALVVVISLWNVAAEEEENVAAEEEELEPYRTDLIGFIYEAPRSLGEPDPAEEFREKYGSPETLEGTDNTTWVVYWSKGDFTTLIKKSNMEIYQVTQGKVPLK